MVTEFEPFDEYISKSSPPRLDQITTLPERGEVADFEAPLRLSRQFFFAGNRNPTKQHTVICTT